MILHIRLKEELGEVINTFEENHSKKFDKEDKLFIQELREILWRARTAREVTSTIQWRIEKPIPARMKDIKKSLMTILKKPDFSDTNLLADQIEGKNQEIQDMRKQMAKLTQLKNANNQPDAHSSIQDRLEKLEQTISTLQTELLKQKTINDMLQQENTLLQTQVNKLSVDNISKQQELMTAKSTLTTLQQSYENKVLENSQLLKRIEELEAELAKLKKPETTQKEESKSGNRYGYFYL